MKVIAVDIAIVGAGGAGLRAAIAAAEADCTLKILLVSKVYPMRSHTVAAEGGSAGVVQPHDSLEDHFNDTVTGGDWLCDQDVVDYFVAHCTEEMVQLEHWGCPWSRKPDGHVNVRAFGGMKIERTWFAADKTGFHMLHTLFQTSIKYPSIKRLDEYFCTDLIVEDGRCQGVVAIDIASGDFTFVAAKAVIIATGGAGRVYQQNTNGGIVTGDGMAMAFRHGVALRDMEFVQYHPTCMPGSGLLFTEACRGEGGILTNKDGYRYLQDYGLGPPDPWPRNKAMELGPRDRLSQAFWHEERKGRTIATPGTAKRSISICASWARRKLRERLPQICELAESFLGIDPAEKPIPVRPAVHYTMGGDLGERRNRDDPSRPFCCRENVRASVSTAQTGSARTPSPNSRSSAKSLARLPRVARVRCRRGRLPCWKGRRTTLPPRRRLCATKPAASGMLPCATRWRRAWRRVAASIAWDRK